MTLYNGVTDTIKIKVVNNCLSLNVDAYQISLDNSNVTRIKYGESVRGRPLEAYEIVGTEKITKTFIMTFAIHGFEDSYKKDGKVLVEEANKLIEYYANNPSELKNTRVIIIPCLNPDGTIEGKNNLRACSTAFGRCTYEHIDMNRDFISTRFLAKESQAFRDFLKENNPDIFIDFHGWLDESLGTSTICNIATDKLSLNKSLKKVYAIQSGYLFGYVYAQYNCPSALIEFKSPTKVNHKQVYTFTNAIISRYNKSK